MIRRLWRAIERVLGSGRLAFGVLTFVGVWSAVATVVPQGAATDRAIAAWAAGRPALASVVSFLGLHQAFTSPLFIAAAALLGLSTSVCSWRRTRVALARMRTMRGIDRGTSGRSGAAVPLPAGMPDADALGVAADHIGSLGIRCAVRDGSVVGVSHPLSVWGSPIFHWALVALLVVVAAGQLVRAEGLMAIPVGSERLDQPTSYVKSQAGPWHAWPGAARRIRVDAFDPAYRLAGIDRGAVPTVSVLDGDGRVVARQLVYPNAMLHAGPLSISAPDCGLAVTLALSGSTRPVTQLVAFDQDAQDGTVPMGTLARSGSEGKLSLAVTVPLERSGSGFGEWIPKTPTTRVRVATQSGEVLLDQVIGVGEVAGLPGGGTVRLLAVGWHAQLSVVDDPTVPLVYGAMLVALAGLTITLLMRQHVVVVGVTATPDGGRALSVTAHLWRNAPTTRDELLASLTSRIDALAKRTGQEGIE